MNERKVPEVRFQGFSGDWEHRLFSYVFATPIPTNTLSRADLNYEDGEVKNIHYGDVLIKFGEITNVKSANIPFITHADMAKYKGHFLANGDIIFADAAEDETVGKATEIMGIDKDKIVSGLHTIAVRSNSLTSVGYMGYYINSSLYRKQLFPLMQGIKVLSISKRSLASTTLNYPLSEKEQTKIGEFFKNLDTLIALNQSKYDKLVNMKKACLDKMFPKEGADTPEVRFQGFSGEWEKKELRDMIIMLTGGVSIKPSDYTDNGAMTIPKGSINSSGIADLRGIKFVSQDFFDKNNLNSASTEDIVTSLRDLVPTAPNMGRIVQIKGRTARYLMPQGVYKVELYSQVDTYFIISYSNSDIYRKIISSGKNGSTQVHIRNGEFLDIKISVPQFAEQTKIGTFFQNLDNLIILRKTELEKLKNIKKALLDKMFI